MHEEAKPPTAPPSALGGFDSRAIYSEMDQQYGVEQQQVSSAAPRRLRLWGPVGEMSVGGVRRRGSC